jgi:hypothetical protein
VLRLESGKVEAKERKKKKKKLPSHICLHRLGQQQLESSFMLLAQAVKNVAHATNRRTEGAVYG